jgi:hypothetical protein
MAILAIHIEDGFTKDMCETLQKEVNSEVIPREAVYFSRSIIR